jgi:hypothetical protein
MRRSALLVLTLTLACAATSPNKQGWVVNGDPVPDEAWRKHDGPFLAMLVVTDQAEALYDRWNTVPGNFATHNIHSAVPGESRRVPRRLG